MIRRGFSALSESRFSSAEKAPSQAKSDFSPILGRMDVSPGMTDVEERIV